MPVYRIRDFCLINTQYPPHFAQFLSRIVQPVRRTSQVVAWSLNLQVQNRFVPLLNAGADLPAHYWYIIHRLPENKQLVTSTLSRQTVPHFLDDDNHE